MWIQPHSLIVAVALAWPLRARQIEHKALVMLKYDSMETPTGTPSPDTTDYL